MDRRRELLERQTPRQRHRAMWRATREAFRTRRFWCFILTFAIGLAVIQELTDSVLVLMAFGGGLGILQDRFLHRRIETKSLLHELECCAECGYSLHANESGTCPECGSAIEHDVD